MMVPLYLLHCDVPVWSVLGWYQVRLGSIESDGVGDSRLSVTLVVKMQEFAVLKMVLSSVQLDLVVCQHTDKEVHNS